MVDVGALVKVKPSDKSTVKELNVFVDDYKQLDYWDVYDPKNKDDVKAHAALRLCVEKSVEMLLSIQRKDEQKQFESDKEYFENERMYFEKFRNMPGPWDSDYGDEPNEELFHNGDYGRAEYDNEHDSYDNNTEYAIDDDEYEYLSPARDGTFNTEIYITSSMHDGVKKLSIKGGAYDATTGDDHASRLILYNNVYSFNGKELTRHLTSLYTEQDGLSRLCKGWGINKVCWDMIEEKVKMKELNAFVVENIVQAQTIRALLRKMARPTTPSDRNCRWHFRADDPLRVSHLEFVILSASPLKVDVLMPTQGSKKFVMELLRHGRDSLAQHMASLALNASFMKTEPVEPPSPQRRFSKPVEDWEDNQRPSDTNKRHNTRKQNRRFNN